MKITRGLWVLCGLLAGAASLPSQDVGGLRVIVSASNGVSSLSRQEVADMFLRKVTSWQDGASVVSVDQSMASPVRTRFSKEILGRSLSEVRSYWEKRIMSGRGQPPPIKANDEAVVKFVAGNAGAIGYVSDTMSLPAAVKVLRVLD